MTKVLLTGANGQLGSDILKHLPSGEFDVIPVTHEEMDLRDLWAVKTKIMEVKPSVIINTAAFHNVEKCESDPQMAKLINMRAPQFMARMSRYLNIRFIHFSTDYVFDGNRDVPYTEGDMANPLNMYGKTKRAGEILIKDEGCNHLVLRVSALYGEQPCRAKNGLNFVELMLKLAHERGGVKVVNNEFVSPTSTRNIASQLPSLIKSDIQGIAHLTSEGSCSWYEFAEEIFRYTHTDVTLDKALAEDFPAKVARPGYSVLENQTIKKRNLNNMMHWKDALHEYLDNRQRLN